ncbi:hypothetical protein MNBD_NITROSPINAE04-1024 [hydrothermal vent metagenome]|uniref:Prepilin-type N-terminal cleavage/methylation domain-containing protein n=1 Tax=hydrothermal vent metagenome TaxID=652676 RepID=A0A3B1BJV8_9ZZZZ
MRIRKSDNRLADGFTLIEILAAIVIASVIGAAFITPYFVSARAFGPGAPADQGRLSFMALGQMELFRSELSALSANQWTSSIISLASASPYRVADGHADGKTFAVSRSVVCFNSDLATYDQSCSSGYALVSVTISEPQSGQSLTLSLVKTKEGF